MSTNPKQPATAFTQWLHACREQRGLSLREVAEQTGVDYTVLCRFETGERVATEEQARKLADFFGADATEAQALRIAGQFLKKYGDHPALRSAVFKLAEQTGVYQMRRKGAR